MRSMDQLLTPSRARCRVPGTSKKAIFENIAGLLAADHPELDATIIISNLLAREKLGSTGLGSGIAIPHCRLPSCTEPLGVMLSLETPADFDAPDEHPVDLLFALLVPEEACQEHLDILAAVARLFSQEELCRELRNCRDDDCMYRTAIAWQG